MAEKLIEKLNPSKDLNLKETYCLSVFRRIGSTIKNSFIEGFYDLIYPGQDMCYANTYCFTNPH